MQHCDRRGAEVLEMKLFWLRLEGENE